MKKVTTNSNIKDIAEIGQGILDINKTHEITEDAFFTTTFERLSAKTDELFGKIKAGWIESELEDKDRARDLDVRAIFYEVGAKCVRRKSEDQAKAEKLQLILNRYGLKITSASYTNESAELRALIKDLKAPNLAEARQAVPDLDALIGNLESSQAAFDESAARHLTNLSERENSTSATVVAKELRDIINEDLGTYMEAMAKVNPDKYRGFANLMNILIEENNWKVRDRLAAVKKNKEELIND
ncbi:hypothetical protein EO244_13575 [Ancylomarina salipaludis]|uniref:Uncharacterized protein n=1 Tax=Ancylomarina salipaludis TaxID=2501299 RepID=A0A4Q1JJ82_9BACT|nr:DUF6261 family protein [Ancylomarina salipaludis]RXQ90427.1 hypothetical protein EO244_13575 [Ancylomarina salipaludis]